MNDHLNRLNRLVQFYQEAIAAGRVLYATHYAAQLQLEYGLTDHGLQVLRQQAIQESDAWLEIINQPFTPKDETTK
jgi:hypothetical protein